MIALRDLKTNELWHCPGLTSKEAEETLWLWLGWGIDCTIVNIPGFEIDYFEDAA